MSLGGVVCTIVAKNYLAHARTLMDSVAQFHPELARVVILVDRPDGYFDPQEESFSVLTSESLDIPDTRWFHFKYTLLELSTAVKPYAIDHLLRKLNFDFVIYLDPDTLLYADLGPVLSSLEEHSMVLTPHLTEPLSDGKRPTELDILRSGIYNLGFVAMVRCDETLAYLEWWKQRLYNHCVVDLPRGLFLDQRWADFAPCFISRFGALRDPGCNVAYWNLFSREVSLNGGKLVVNGVPLRFFHFSGFDPGRAGVLSKHQNRFQLEDLPAVKELTRRYRQLLLANGYESCHAWPNAYGCFENGASIPDLGRPLPEEHPGITETIEDPFSDEGYRAFVSIWNEPLEGRAGGRPKITRLAYRLYRTRHDIQAAMPDIFNGDYREFVRWLTSNATGDHDLPDVFLTPFRTRDIADGPTEALAHAAPAADAAYSPMTRLALQIYNKRPDLQAYFPDPAGADAAKYLVWLLSYGRRQYTLSEVYLSELRRQWLAIVDQLPALGARLRYRALLRASIATAALSPLVSRTKQIPAWLVKFMARPSQPSGVPLRAEPTPISSAPRKRPVPVVAVARFDKVLGERGPR